MAVNKISSDGTLWWQCLGGEDEHCMALLSCHVSDAVYRPYEQGARGAMIDLPACHVCGAHCSLKADYSMRELFKATQTLIDISNGIIGYALKMPHVHNILIHHWLYQHGQAKHAPALSIPERETLSDPRIANLSGTESLALYWGYVVVRERDPRLESFDMMLQELMPVLPPKMESKILPS